MPGKYTDIVEIDAPSTAVAGETVPVIIKIKNTWNINLLIAADGAYDGVPFLHMEYWIPAGETHSFSGSFTMPSNGVTIHASSSYWLFGDIWEPDDEAEKDVSLAPPEDKGELQDIEYWNPISGEWESTSPTFPIDHWNGLACRGVNLADKNQWMYMYFYAYDPHGVLRDSYSTDVFEIKPGAGFSANFGIYCDILGDYTTTCQLGIWGVGIVDEITKTVCHATAAPEVDARIDTWWLWDAVEDDWVKPSPTLIPPGSDIGIRVRGKNTCDVEIDIRADVRYHSPTGRTKTFTGDIITVPPGQPVSEYPLWDFLWEADESGDWECNIILYAGLPGESLEEVDRRDSVAVAHVAIYVPPEEYEGTITEKELEYNESRKSIPASDVPIGQRGLVHIWGRNDMDTTQQMGIDWVVRDPDGIVVEEYSAWEMWPYTPPGDDHEFIGGRFDLDKEGVYTLEVNLLMNQDNPVTVDSYQGNLCTVTPELPPEFELIQETIYPFAYIYEGWQETCVYALTVPLPEQIGPPAWIGDLIANAFANKVEEQGERVLELRVYADTTPTFWTDYRIEVTSTIPAEGTSGIAFPWAAVIIGVIVILGIVVLTWSIEKIYKLFFKPKPLSEEIKLTWSRGTLIGAINDFEVKLELTPTPPEELEGMSDQELRDYCNELAAEVVPPTPPEEWALVALAGIGVLGLGAVAVAYALTKPE